MSWSGSSVAPFVPSPLGVARRMLTLAGLKEGERLYDLGCGDGRILILAAQEFGADAVGVDLNMNLVKEGREKILKLGLDGKVKIIHGDLFDTNIGSADVVTLYLTTSANEKVRPKMEKELKKGTRVVSHDFTIPGWKPVKTEKVGENFRTHTIYLYIK